MTTRGALGIRTLLFLAVLCGAGTAHAQATTPVIEEGNGEGAELRLFRPAVDSKGIFAVNASPVLGHLDLSFGLVADGGLGIMPLAGLEDDLIENAIPSQFTGTLHANVGLFNFMVVGLQLPIGILEVERIGDPQEGPDGRDGRLEGMRVSDVDQCTPDPGPDLILGNADDGPTGPTFVECRTVHSMQGLADIILHAKFQLLRVQRNPIGVGIVFQAGFPAGDADRLIADPGGSIWPSLVIDAEPSRRLRIALNAGYRMVLGEGSTFGNQDDDGHFTYGDHATFGVGISYQLVLGTLDFAVEGYGNQLMEGDNGSAAALAAEAIGGFKVYVERNSYLYIGAGPGVTNGFNAADTRFVLGFIFEPSIGDKDGDGIKDDVDRCPDDPEDYDVFEDEDGCPEPDNDRDGILDVDDECPVIPEDRDGTEDTDGCPEGNEGDRDGDGILDAVDQCPDDPEDRDNFEDEEGCPDPDNDQDRILDVDDTCPNDPETYNGTDDEDGCPDQGRVLVEADQIVILDKIYFETDSAVIQERSFPIIDAVAATLQGNPQIRKIEIQGHADERAPDDYNIRLTRDRAASVVDALVQRGVERARVRSAGYGERCPVDPRHNDQAWDRNRRVEFKIIETDAGPTGVEVACPAGRQLVPNN